MSKMAPIWRPGPVTVLVHRALRPARPAVHGSLILTFGLIDYGY